MTTVEAREMYESLHEMKCDNCEQLKKTLKDIKEAALEHFKDKFGYQIRRDFAKIGREFFSAKNQDGTKFGN
uniref:Uncharacterized protein n=1 Tax=Romanomermis culicivorax TaxID=13658 RepID=A0A915I1I8_ROMCU